MSRETSDYVVGDYWLDKRRDGRSPDIWQITHYAPKSRSIVYRSTGKRLLEEAKAALRAFDDAERAKGQQDPRDARVIPLLLLYWKEKGRKNINHDQTGRSIRTFIGFLLQDDVGPNAVVTDLIPAVLERFREWRMGPHHLQVGWGGQMLDYSSTGVSGDTVNRNLNDIRAGLNHAQSNMRINYSPKVKAIDRVHLNPLRERVLTLDELARIVWYSFHFPALFRFVALQICTSVRPEAAKRFNPLTQYNHQTGLIDLQPDAAPRTKKRNAVVPAIRQIRPVLRAWQRDGYTPVDSNKTAWRKMRRVLGLSDDVFPKTIRHTIATWLYADDSVPEREIEALLGHATDLHRTTQLYAKYDPKRLAKAVRALSTIWSEVSKAAKAHSAVHLLSTCPGKPYRVIKKT